MGRKNEQGFLLLDMAISLPILILIMMSLVTISVASVRYFYRAYAMQELRYEVQNVMLRIVEDMATARDAEWTDVGYGDGLKITRRPYFKNNLASHSYFAYTKDHVKNIYFGSSDFPLTGKNDLATVQITYFHMDELGNGLCKVTIKGEVIQLAKSYELSTYVHVEKEGKT